MLLGHERLHDQLLHAGVDHQKEQQVYDLNSLLNLMIWQHSQLWHLFRILLFLPSSNQVMVGADLSSIELRLLAHYLSRYDDHFRDTLLNGDIHQVNADKVGVSRRQIKTIIYAWCYGAGNEKLGLSFDPGLSPNKAKKKGKEIREAFVKAIPGMSQLLEDIEKATVRGYMIAIDGRKITLDSRHKALNYLLQLHQM